MTTYLIIVSVFIGLIFVWAIVVADSNTKVPMRQTVLKCLAALFAIAMMCNAWYGLGEKAAKNETTPQAERTQP
jgi:quinol-cytochrome oxidoreductase complex cytochrome b subunit